VFLAHDVSYFVHLGPEAHGPLIVTSQCVESSLNADRQHFIVTEHPRLDIGDADPFSLACSGETLPAARGPGHPGHEARR
jgi:hypothetical protein